MDNLKAEIEDLKKELEEIKKEMKIIKHFLRSDFNNIIAILDNKPLNKEPYKREFFNEERKN